MRDIPRIPYYSYSSAQPSDVAPILNCGFPRRGGPVASHPYPLRRTWPVVERIDGPAVTPVDGGREAQSVRLVGEAPFQSSRDLEPCEDRSNGLERVAPSALTRD